MNSNENLFLFLWSCFVNLTIYMVNSSVCYCVFSVLKLQQKKNSSEKMRRGLKEEEENSALLCQLSVYVGFKHYITWIEICMETYFLRIYGIHEFNKYILLTIIWFRSFEMWIQIVCVERITLPHQPQQIDSNCVSTKKWVMCLLLMHKEYFDSLVCNCLVDRLLVCGPKPCMLVLSIIHVSRSVQYRRWST